MGEEELVMVYTDHQNLLSVLTKRSCISEKLDWHRS